MLKQSLQQKLLQKLSPQQIQLMKLLQVPTIELEQRIKEELEANPALDEGAEKDPDEEPEQNDDNEESEKTETEEFDFSDYIDDDETPAYKLNINNSSSDSDEKSIPFASGTSFRDHLKEQLSWRNITDKQELLAKTIIGNLDDDGYLRREVDNISDDLAFSQNIMASAEELEEALRIVQNLDPAGVGARDLRECLMLQLARKDNSYPSVKIATEILDKYFEAFTKKHYDRITKRMEVDNEDLKVAISEIVKLNPKPGNKIGRA